MAKYPFLSEDWIVEARKIRDAHAGQAPLGAVIRMNQVVTGAPFGTGTILAHLDTSSGAIVLDLGHLEKPDVTLTVDYETAKAIFVGQNMQAAMSAMLNGKIVVQGDMTKLLLLSGGMSGSDSAAAKEIAEQISAITAD